MTTINQKEYLKKYLGLGKYPGDKKKKKKKEKASNNHSRVKIIDDDADVVMSQGIQEDLAAENEDAPQIVAVIDERPIALQIDEYTKTSMWKPLGEPSTAISEIHSLKVNSFKLSKQERNIDGHKSNMKTERNSKIKISDKGNSTAVTIKQDKEQSVSPIRRTPERSRSNRSSLSPRTGNKRDYSPPRKRINKYSPSRKSSEQKISDNRSSSKETDETCSQQRRSIEKDSSPPRRKSGIDSLTPRRNRNSPPPKSRSDDDSSPPRRKNNLKSLSPKRHSSPPKTRSDGDNSPPRKRNKENDRDYSPPRRRKNRNDNISPKRTEEKDISPLRMKINPDDYSPKRRNRKLNDSAQRRENSSYRLDGTSPTRSKLNSPPTQSRERKKSRWNPERSPEHTNKMKKTLDGKQAGLQSAENLSKESKIIREREDEMFKNLSLEVSGRGAATVFRNKKVKDLEEEAAKQKRASEMKEKYDLWGRGLKQVEDQNQRIQDQLHEMSKPLARYADDEDLEGFLKQQERDGDPMLDYIRKKKRKEKVEAGIPEKPMYMGEFMPNRFGIRPGYRWDGVDRSNGYEKKWFQVQNAKRANQEEAFKWSTEDM